MNIFKKIHSAFQYSIKLIKIMLKFDNAYFIYILLDIIAYSSITFINLFLVKYSILMLENRAEFVMFIFVVIGLILINMILNCLHSYLNYKRDLHGSTISISLMKSIFHQTLNLDYELLLDKDIQEKRRLASQITANNRFTSLSNTFYVFISNIIVIVGIISILAQIDVWILLISLVVVVVNTFVSLNQNKFRRAIDIDLNSISRKIAYFNEIGGNFSYSKDIKIFEMVNPLIKRFLDIQNEWHNKCNKVIRNSLFGYYISYVTNFILNVIVYVYLGFKVLVYNLLSIANFSMFLTAILNFNECIQSIVNSFSEISSNAPYLQDYFVYMSLKTMNEESNLKLNEVLKTTEYKIVFDNVYYKYPHQETYSLKNINFEIKHGEKIAIVGENGAGKTTMVLLLMRLIEPTKGRILLNGVDIRKYNVCEYRKLFSTVFQDFNLFSFTIEENITALNETNLTQFEKAIRCVGLSKKISSLDNGVKTYIDKLYDNKGVTFSGGEGQRLAIARALYKDAPIYVLDEPTAALDPIIENEIYTKFKDITECKTAFYITHRLASTHICNRIIVLKSGRIVEVGNHKELMKRNGYYAELYNMQAQYYSE